MTTNTTVVGPGAVTAPPRGDRRAPNRVRRRRQFTAGLVMLAPLAVLLGALLGWPIIWTLLLSLTNEQLTGPTALHHQYIGFANFSALFHDPEFLSSLLHSIYYLVGSAYVGQVALGLALAFLLRACSRRVQAAVGGYRRDELDHPGGHRRVHVVRPARQGRFGHAVVEASLPRGPAIASSRFVSHACTWM